MIFLKIVIRGDKISITKSIKDYVTDKMGRLDKYFENAKSIECKVLIRVKNLEQTIEVTVPTTKFTLRAEESHQDLYAAIDLVIDKLERQIRRNKTRIGNKYKDVPKFEMNMDFDVPEEELETEVIVKRKNIDMKPMDEEEALLQIELLNHDFFVFKNIDEDCVSVLYKRKDNSFGIINVK